MTDQDRSYLNKIDPQTASTLLSLPEGQDPMVSVAVEWRVPPSAAEMAVIAASGGQWQNPAGAGMAPSSIQTLRLPLRAGEGLARLGGVGSVTAAQPLGHDDTDPPPPAAGFGKRP